MAQQLASRVVFVSLAWTLLWGGPGRALAAEGEESFDEENLSGLSLGELLNMEIVTASNVAEKISDAPATVLVVTAEDIENRGYTDLVDLFGDIPGIDISITFGDLYFRPYWRGFRKGATSPFLFMVDGLVMNHVWFNWTDVMTAVPLSNIKQIEVVYGPASSVYGPNAMMGVINVVTQNDREADGTEARVRVTGGNFDARVADMTMLYKRDDFRLRVSGMLNHGDMDVGSLSSYEWTNPNYLSDPTLWYACLENQHICGEVTSPRKNRALTLSLYLGDFEVGAHYYRVGDMYGTNYAFDKMQPQGIWVEEDYLVYMRNNTKLTEKLTSQSLLKYRRSDVPNESNSIERWGDDQVHFGIWQSLNDSWTAEQSFAAEFGDNFLVKTGLKYEMRYYQKAYDLPYGEALGPEADLTEAFYPDVPTDVYQSNNRVTWVDQGAYVQTRYNLRDVLRSDESHYLNLGMRYDRNSFFAGQEDESGNPKGGNWTFRAGYVGHAGDLTAKLLFGQAIQEPSPRQLYGGWGGSGSDPNLQPEKSRTLEVFVGYVDAQLGLGLNPYVNWLSHVIRNPRQEPENTGESTVFGLDVHANTLLDLGGGHDLKLWGFYSWLDAREDNFQRDGELAGTRDVGDLADHKLFFGVTGRTLERKLVMTLRGRYIGARKVVAGNPIGWRLESTDADGNVVYDDETDASYVGSLYEPCGEGESPACPDGTGYGDGKVDAYLTLDLSLVWRDFLSGAYEGAQGVSLGVHVKNLLDTQYFHPGTRAANSGLTAGARADDGSWQGSRGWSNSLLPQPGRQILMTLQVEH